MAARYENLKSIKDEQFRRLTGVKRHTFNRMLEILQEARIGAPKAITATAHKLAVIIYNMLKKGVELWRVGKIITSSNIATEYLKV